LYFRNLYNRFKDTELQPESVFDYRNGDLENQTATSGTFTEGEAARTVQERLEIQSIQSSSLGGEWRTAHGRSAVADLRRVGAGHAGRRRMELRLDDENPDDLRHVDKFFNVEAGPKRTTPVSSNSTK
jgi:hypothetical protein